MTKSEVIDELEKRGVEFNKRSSATKLRDLLDNSEEVLDPEPVEDKSEVKTIGAKYSGMKKIGLYFVTKDGAKHEDVLTAARYNFTLGD